MILFLLCLALTVVAILLFERLVQPGGNAKPLFHALSPLAALPAFLYYITVFMISYRPVTSMAITLIAFASIVAINNAKFRALKEPLLFSDFSLFRQVLRHPVLYVKYIGTANIVAMVAGFAVVVVAGALAEPSVVPRHTVAAFVPTALYLFLVFGTIYAVTRGPLRATFVQLFRRFGLQTDVRRDIDKLSLVVVLIVYFILANEPDSRQSPQAARAKPPADGAAARPVHTVWPEADAGLPSIVVVQNESFFDARRVGPAVRQDILAQWDRIAARSAYHGRLEVPAWGANTMRTEFTFLAGLPPEVFGLQRFNPYLRLCKRPVWTIAHQLRGLGYRTVFVHPFAPEFFGRDQVVPNLGFDRFVDIAAFEGSETFGPYVSDRSVADKIAALLEDDGPQFIFAVTMENHGRWERGRLDGVTALHELADPPLNSAAFGFYLRHLANADAMAGRLVDMLEARGDGAVFCMFGDHVPSLPDVFATAGYADGRTDYVVWRQGQAGAACALDISVDALGHLVLHAGLTGLETPRPDLPSVAAAMRG